MQTGHPPKNENISEAPQLLLGNSTVAGSELLAFWASIVNHLRKIVESLLCYSPTLASIFGNEVSANRLKRFKRFAETSFPKIDAKVGE